VKIFIETKIQGKEREPNAKRKRERFRVVTPKPSSSASTSTRGTQRQGENEDTRRRLDERRQWRTKNQTASRPGKSFLSFLSFAFAFKRFGIVRR